ncbi:hypothetical protein RchiOBHm_Chr6g0268651 [Rosa chinensis]|uniref:Uncharacterized protein n=1 Tax=Rosa chinensis TaxID=74649 RepID=A0A2P6PQ81_ROSCH|nr:hypothetical protein RchiOBHm_Chr6g0268651 [Rosa chinensis]
MVSDRRLLLLFLPDQFLFFSFSLPSFRILRLRAFCERRRCKRRQGFWQQVEAGTATTISSPGFGGEGCLKDFQENIKGGARPFVVLRWKGRQEIEGFWW